MPNRYYPIVVAALLGALAGAVALLVNDPDTRPAQIGFADAVSHAAPSVVSIYSSKAMEPALCKLPRYKAWCETSLDRSASRVDSSLGSGVIIRSDGHILTNNHVIEDAEEILVGLASGEVLKARVIGRDRESDLAVIHVTGAPTPPIVLQASDSVRVGEIALAIGNPFGIGQTVSQGIISAVRRVVVGVQTYDDFMQTDAAINPGNSGGALVNQNGDLIGINTMIFSREAGSQGIGFAIPSSVAKYVFEEILAHGRVRRSWLGIELSQHPSKSGQFGFVISLVEANGPAEQGGLKVGDVLLALDGQMPADPVAISRQVGKLQPGSRLEVTIERAGVMQTLVIITSERPQEDRSVAE